MTESIEKEADAIEWVTPRPANWNDMTDERKEAVIDQQKRFYAAMHRKPEQMAVARQLAEEHVIPGRPLPPGKTLEDVFVGAIQDDMTEEEVIQALKDL